MLDLERWEIGCGMVARIFFAKLVLKKEDLAGISQIMVLRAKLVILPVVEKQSFDGQICEGWWLAAVPPWGFRSYNMYKLIR